MPTITVDGKQIEAQPGQMILQACLDADIEVPHYCYHPGLSIVASCRICLAEVEGVPKLLPTCQTPVRDGMVVHTRSTKSVANQKQVMEYLLINHPLDCPVCDQSGECYLQDYSYQYGRSTSRFEEDKIKSPKKLVGKNVMLYGDRCIMCTRCVRFTREVTGTAELMVEGRGSREEINIFPGKPLDNKLSVNVTDLCPVGALLDRDFLFKQRVWLLKSAKSISPVDAGGENIYLQYNEGVVYRIKPRFNPDVNDWWISDDTRYSYKPLFSDDRLSNATAKRHGVAEPVDSDIAVDAAATNLRQIVAEHGEGSLFGVLSPMMACEEAWLLGTYLRSLDPQALLVMGPVFTGEDEVFHHYDTGKETFRIQGEKVPNRKGIERVLQMLGGPTGSFADLDNNTKLKGGWVTGGYLSNWTQTLETQGISLPGVITNGFTVVQDILPNAATRSADVLIPSAAWAEKEGSWANYEDRLQPFQAAVDPPTGVMRDGAVYLRLLGRTDRYDAANIRQEMGEPFAAVAFEHDEADQPAFEFAEL